MKNIILTGDWHIQTLEDAKRIDKLMPKTSPMILMGDLIDSGLDKGMQWNQDNVSLQLEYLQMILKHRKVLGYVLGNHELRIVKATGLNPYLTLLGKEQSEYFVIARHRKTGLGTVRSIAIEHGTRVVQNPLAQLKQFALIHPDADVLALGHDHTLGYWRDGNQWLVRTGNLQLYPDYARRAILPKKVQGYIKYSPLKNTLEVILA